MLNLLKVTILAMSFAVCLTACKDAKNTPQSTSDTLFELTLGDISFKAQLAVSDAEKMRGLMFRESLPQNDGMLFVYERPVKASFWMKNTLIPLDIGFFDKNGVLTEIRKLYPQNLDSVKSSRNDILYCLEMNAGWFEKNNIKSSAKLDMNKLSKAIASRKNK